MRTLFLFILLLSSLFPQQLTWNHLVGPMGGAIGDIAINSNGHIYAGVYTNIFSSQVYAGLFKSTDNGDTWNKIDTHFEDFQVYSLYVTDNDHIFVGTNFQGVIYRSTDDGQTWGNTANGYVSNECWAFGQNSSKTVIFAGDGQYAKLCRSTDNGDNWQLSANLPVLAFAVDSFNNIYCGTFVGLYRSTDDGLSWEQIGFDNIPISTILIADHSGVICGTGYYDNGQGVFYSTDYGNTWDNIGLNAEVVLSLAFTSYGSLLAGTSINGVFETTDLGNNWVQHNNGLFQKQVFRLKVNDSDDIFVGSEFEGVFRSTDFGNNFKHVGLPISGIYNIAFLGDSLVVAATVSGVQTYNRLTHKWDNIGLHAVLAVETDENGNIYAGTNGGGLFFSSDLGINWINICQVPYILNVKKNNKTILAATTDYLIRSTDGGNTWENTPVNSGVDNCAIEININGDVWATGYVGELYKSTDSGLTFELSNNLNFSLVDRNNLYVNDSLIFMGDRTVGIGIFYSTDYGITWENKYHQTTIASVNGNGNYIIAGTREDIIYSTNNGSTLDSIPYPEDFYGIVSEIEFDKNGQLFFGTSSNGLYEMDFVVSIEDDPPTNENFILYPPYPNPFNSTVTIRYDLPVDSDIKVTLYNILGEEIKVLNLFRRKGNNEERISFEELVGGIYFIALEGKDFFAVNKAAFLK
jgi:photosystem II stability/assembly factor-like uncharacterized protein